MIHQNALNKTLVAPAIKVHTYLFEYSEKMKCDLDFYPPPLRMRCDTQI